MSKSYFITIIGSGFAGLGMGIKLKQQGINDFLIIERANEVGGTWRDNIYPGVACDVPSHLYSFSFIKNPNWTRIFPKGPEIQDYLISCSHSENVRDHIQFNTSLETASWDEVDKNWIIRTSNNEIIKSKYLITATGHLADEHLPNIPGLDTFTGEIIHSARWNENVNLSDKNVAVVGSGASAIQLVPELSKTVKKLTVFQRSAPYILPRPDREYSEIEKELFKKDPSAMDDLRHELFWSNEINFSQRRNIKEDIEKVKRSCMKLLNSQIENPDLIKKLTPNYEPGCKRVLLSNNYYPTFLESHVTLEDSALYKVENSYAISKNNNKYEIDVLVFATGFEASKPPYASKVFGKLGYSLEQQWIEGMQGYQSTTVHNFPNLFILNGPNTGSGHNSALYFLEAQFDLVLDALDYLVNNKYSTFEPKKDAEDLYMSNIQELSKGSVWLSSGCKSWYLDPVSNKLTLIWPDFAHTFRALNDHFETEGYSFN